MASTNRTRVTRLTRRGLLLLVAGVLAGLSAYVVGRNELVPLGAFLAAAPAIAWVYVRLRPLRFSATRESRPPVLEAGTRSEVTLQIRNDSAYRSPVANWRDTWLWRPFATAPRPFGRLAAGPGGSMASAYEVTPSRRGSFEVGPAIIDFSDPFGLADGAVIASGTSRLIVTPAIVELPEGAVAIAADEGPTRLRQRRSFGGDDDLMTREYREGDAMRRVHWRASAHHGELMVRQEEQRSHAEARVVLETRRAGYRDSRGAGTIDEPESESFEWAVSMCASLSLYLAERGFIVQVIETGDPQLSPVDDFDEFMKSLAAVELVATNPRWLTLLDGVSRPDRPQGSVFAILSSAETSTVERLIAQRGAFDLAVAFLVEPGSAPQAQSLRAAGWLCVAVHPTATLDEAWLALAAQQEIPDGRP
ncbi:MAG: DUF58 domain-containing protein [Actinomycetota bacterium]